MTTTLVITLILSVLFQISAAFCALRLIKLTGKTYSWLLISFALFLMCIRRIIPLYCFLFDMHYDVDFLNEIIGLVLSIFMFFGVFSIKSIFIERKRVEEEIKQKNEELSKINGQKDRFFSIIAHDLRNPFNSLLGLTQLLTEELSTLTNDQIRRSAMTMRKATTQMYSLLENLLEWSRMQRGMTPFMPESIEVLPIISQSLDMYSEVITSKKLDIIVAVPENMKVVADHYMFETIIRNLISNAIKFTDRGGKIIIAAKQVAGHLIEISIKDTGIGMSQILLENLFSLDVQTTRTGTENEPSTGLGLLIIKDFVEKHNSKLKIESEEDKGSTFSFELPAADPY